MKTKRIVLLLASVFFCVLASCGMPTIFYPSSSEYTLTKLVAPTDDQVTGKMSMNLNPGPNRDLLNDSSVQGPSLMFFYAFGGKDATDYMFTSSDISSIQSKFASTFIKDQYSATPVTEPKEILSITKGSEEIYLYGFNQSSGVYFSATDNYVLYPTGQANNAALDSFTLKKSDHPSLPQYKLDLSHIKGPTSPPFMANATELYDYDGKPFTLDKNAILDKIESIDNNEYSYVGDNPSEITLHLFTAFFVAGPFTNFFWSKLIHLGEIPITLL